MVKVVGILFVRNLNFNLLLRILILLILILVLVTLLVVLRAVKVDRLPTPLAFGKSVVL